MTVDYNLLSQARSTDADQRQKVAAQIAQSLSEDELPLVFEMLGDRDWRVRKTIVEGLLRKSDESIIRGLVSSLHDPENAGKRNSATEALIRIGERAIPFIIFELSRESDLDVRLSLVNLLGDLRDADGFAALVGLIGTETDVNIVSSSIASLGKYRDDRALPTLLGALEKEDLWIKFHVIEALGEVGDRRALPAILGLYGEKSLRKPVLEAVGKIGDIGTLGFLLKIITDEEKLNLTALRSLVRIAEAEKPRIVEIAERSLIQRKFRQSFPSEKIPPLVEHLNTTPKRDVKNFILKFLGWSGDERALPVLLTFVDQPESAECAAQALVDFGSQAAGPILEKLRTTDEDDVVTLLLRVVHAVAGSEAVPTVIGFLDHENASVRRLAIETFGEILEPATVDYLLAKLDDPDVACQQAAVNSISALVSAFPEIKADTLSKIRRLQSSTSIPVQLNSLSIFVNIQGEGYHDELLLASKDEDQVIRQKAVSLMGRFGEERFADQLVLSLADESPAVRLAAINAIVRLRPEKGLSSLLASLDDDDVWIRTAAAQALGEYRDPATIEPLVRHLAQDAPPVRIAAIEALGKSEDRSVRETLVNCLGQQDPEIQRAAILGLARIPGQDVLEELLRALGSADWRLRAAAAIALGQRGDNSVLEKLHKLLVSDPDAYVQQSAVVALDRMPDRSSFPFLMQAMDNPAILDDISDLFIRHKDVFRDLLERAWRTADSRHEMVIAAILQALKTPGIGA